MAGLARAALLAAATVAAAAGSGGVGGLLLGREVQLDAARTPRAIAARVVVCEAAVGRALHHDLALVVLLLRRRRVQSPTLCFFLSGLRLSLSDTFGFCLFCGGRDITTHRVAVIVRLGLGLGLGLALGQVRVMVRVRVSSVPPRREHSGVPPCSKCTPLPAAYPLPRSRSAIGYIETPVDGTS